LFRYANNLLLIIICSAAMIVSAGDTISAADRLRADVVFLSSITPTRSVAHNDSLRKAAAYIEKEFRAAGGEVSSQPVETRGMDDRNIICSFGPASAERIVIGAHYDACGDTPGADDNASGIAGLLELARMIAREKPELKRRIELVAYTLEEPPYYGTPGMGSFTHARSLAAKNVRVKIMISLEMIGYYTDEPNSQRFPSGILKLFYPDRGNFILVAGPDGNIVRPVKKLMEGGALPVESLYYGIELSDHINYWKAGYPAVIVTDTAFYRNERYHTGNDTSSTLDYDKMAEVVRGIYRVITEL
jgi:Zn-dependent M28 family amino/carboxypeptidase